MGAVITLVMSLLSLALAVVLLVIFIKTYVNTRRNGEMLEEILQRLDTVRTVDSQPEEASQIEELAVIEEAPPAEGTEKENEDAAAVPEMAPEASKYNTGKSGKIYTKEELELLIKE